MIIAAYIPTAIIIAQSRSFSVPTATAARFTATTLPEILGPASITLRVTDCWMRVAGSGRASA